MDALAGLTFESPERLWLLLLAIPALLLLVARERQRAMAAERFISERVRGRSNGLRALRPWLIALAISSSVAAAAGPRIGVELRELPQVESNTVIVLDISQSMAANDVGTSRLSAAKAVAKRLIEASPSRFALIVFEGTAEVVSPLTEDHAAVVALLDSLDVGECAEAGSDVSKAIESAIELSKPVGDRSTDVVVISDGEHRGKDWREAMSVARTRGLKISCVVVGSEAGATVPDAEGKMLDDENGQPVLSKASREPLETIAHECGGKFWFNPFEQVTVGSMDVQTRTQSGERYERVPIERYQWPLGAALVLFLGAAIVNRGAE